mmetsp:Transcript_14571/g.24925  ORF Transcript_14571/g.24925 Transcript_14571/m.24925 type:complete len:261 (+) Transcript_14571:361-1143(+)
MHVDTADPFHIGLQLFKHLLTHQIVHAHHTLRCQHEKRFRRMKRNCFNTSFSFFEWSLCSCARQLMNQHSLGACTRTNGRTIISFGMPRNLFDEARMRDNHRFTARRIGRRCPPHSHCAITLCHRFVQTNETVGGCHSCRTAETSVHKVQIIAARNRQQRQFTIRTPLHTRHHSAKLHGTHTTSGSELPHTHCTIVRPTRHILATRMYRHRSHTFSMSFHCHSIISWKWSQILWIGHFRHQLFRIDVHFALDSARAQIQV